MNIHDMNIIKMQLEKMGSPCLFTRQQALNFYWLRLNGYMKGTKFCLESKASFVDISSIASFKPFLIAWLR